MPASPESPPDPGTAPGPRAAPERRNLYRILHVQPEAPVEVIRASYRALMSALRAHPDLGGDTARAAQINAAYAVLRDPVQRAAYDRSLARRGSSDSAFAPMGPEADAACPFCGHVVAALTRPEPRCRSCSAPLTPAPAPERVPGELIGRRRGARVAVGAVGADATLRLRDTPQPVPAVLRDVSVTGVSLACLPALRPGTVVRVGGAHFDALARVVACRPAGPAHLVRAVLLTLALTAPARSGAGPAP
jgi:hypothetical protein